MRNNLLEPLQECIFRLLRCLQPAQALAEAFLTRGDSFLRLHYSGVCINRIAARTHSLGPELHESDIGCNKARVCPKDISADTVPV